jgi:hypothetical protein
MNNILIVDHVSLISTSKPRDMENIFLKMNNIRVIYKKRNNRRYKLIKLFNISETR